MSAIREQGVESRLAFFLRELYFLLLLFVAATLPFPSIKLNSILIIITLVTAAFYFLVSGRDTARFNRWLLLFLLLYITIFLGFIRSTKVGPVLFDLEQKLALLTFPLIFALGPACSVKQSRRMLFFFLLAVLVAVTLSFRQGLRPAYNNNQLYDDLILHRPYLAMYCISGFFFCIPLLIYTRRYVFKILYGIIMLFLFSMPVLLIAKMAALVSVIVAVTTLAISLLQRGNYKILAVLFFVSAIVLQQGMKFDQKNADIVSHTIRGTPLESQLGKVDYLSNSFNLRMFYWQCTHELLKQNNNWLFGIGTSEMQPSLNACYTAGVDSGIQFIENHDPHNQYLLIWLTFGLFPLFLFVFHFFALLYRYFVSGNVVAIAFTLIVMLSCLTEAVFENQKGIVFYALFQSLFIFGEEIFVVKKSSV